MGYLCSGFIFINFNQSFLLCRGILIEAVFPCIRRKFARRVQFMWKLTTHEIDLGNFWNRKPKSRSFPPELTRRKLLEECQYSILAPVSNLTQFHSHSFFLTDLQFIYFTVALDFIVYWTWQCDYLSSRESFKTGPDHWKLQNWNAYAPHSIHVSLFGWFNQCKYNNQLVCCICILQDWHKVWNRSNWKMRRSSQKPLFVYSTKFLKNFWRLILAFTLSHFDICCTQYRYNLS